MTPAMMMATDPITSPADLGDYRVVRALAPGQTFLARAPGGREVVLKMLGDDCLLRGQLHPSIRERLARVRELAERGVANLHGVERDGPYTYLVWDHVPGTTFDQLALEPGLSHREMAGLARELVLVVESLHAAGIVHGSIKPGNVILDPNRRLRLTHVSPLLFSDPGLDVASVIDLLRETIARRGESELPLGRTLAAAKAEPIALRELSARLAALRDPREPSPEAAVAPVTTSSSSAAVDSRKKGSASAQRVLSLLGAAAAALAGLAVFGSVWWYTHQQAADPYAQPALEPTNVVVSPTVSSR
jgi:serine/threonine protein kinase